VATLVQLRPSALIVGSDPFLNSRSEQQLVVLAARHAVPTIYNYSESVTAGGLMSYGTSLVDGWRLAGVYASKILRGAKPADLPVQNQPQYCQDARPHRTVAAARPRRRGDRMSNCHLVAGRSLIALAASRLGLRASALRAATALTRPNRSAQRLACRRHTVPTAKTVGPNDVVANHRVERGDHLTHH